jgi:importin subunit beta-1
MQAIEFWSTCAEIELCLKEDDEEAGVSSGVDTECKDFLVRSANDLVPLLLELLLLQQEDQDTDETDWCVSTL